jgi:hypothetical protein
VCLAQQKKMQAFCWPALYRHLIQQRLEGALSLLCAPSRLQMLDNLPTKLAQKLVAMPLWIIDSRHDWDGGAAAD